jgi:hypothetical protein
MLRLLGGKGWWWYSFLNGEDAVAPWLWDVMVPYDQLRACISKRIGLEESEVSYKLSSKSLCWYFTELDRHATIT